MMIVVEIKQKINKKKRTWAKGYLACCSCRRLVVAINLSMQLDRVLGLHIHFACSLVGSDVGLGLGLRAALARRRWSRGG